MPCIKGRAKHILCKPGCEPECLCCKKLESYSCRPICCFNDLEPNYIKGVSGSENWLYLHFWRSSNGLGNNLFNPDWGSVSTGLNTNSTQSFGDGISTPANRTPNPRFVSNAVSKFSGPDPNSSISALFTWWGQFIDHTLAITPGGTENLSFTSAADTTEDPNETIFNQIIPFTRAEFIPGSSPREHLTQLTAFIDADNVYGKDGSRELALRTMDGTGKLKINGDLPPLNTFGLDNENPTGLPEDELFLLGDVRGNENTALLSIHVIFVRLHNILCDEFVAEFPQFTGQDEVIFQQVKRKIAGIQQHITYTEFLPLLLGSFNLPPYTGYKESVNPTILKEFSTVAYRFGHASVNSDLKIGTSDSLSLNDAFFNPSYIVTNGINDVVLGASLQNIKNITTEVVDELRNTLFGSVLLDLVALNIQRGRDMGLPDYNTLREDYGLPSKATWADVTPNVTLQAKLASVYPTPSDADPWIAGLAEPHVTGGNIGELFATIIREQFIRVRDGDRFWYANDPALRDEDIEEIEGYTLANVINKVTSLNLSGSAFLV
jgi:peroxidase